MKFFFKLPDRAVFNCLIFKSVIANREPLELKNKPAFSLVEMLMALLVASLLLAALAPVMTKRIADGRVNVSGNLADNIYHGYKIFTNMATGDGDNANKEYEFTFPQSTDNNPSTKFNAIIVSGGGGGAGAAPSDVRGTKALSFNQGSAGVSSAVNAVTLPSYTDYRFNRYTDTVKLTLVSGAGGGGGGNGITKTETPKFNQTVCASYGMGKTDTTGHTGTANTPLAVYDSANNMCVSAYNQIASGVRTTGVAFPYCVAYAQGSFSTYVCIKEGALSACQKFTEAIGWDTANSWRLPSLTELGKWSLAFVNNTSPSGAGVCNLSDTSSARYCPQQSVGNGGVGVLSYSKNPSYVWAPGSGYNKYCENGDSGSAFRFSGTQWGGNSLCNTVMVNGMATYGSVRCVLEAKPTEIFYPYTGGSGGGGTSVTIKIPSEVLAKAVELSDDGRGVLRIYAGHGGKGAPVYNNDGYFGQASMVAVYPSIGGGTGVGAKLWHILVPGGGGGKKASTSAGGAAGMAGGTKCSYYFPVSSGGKTIYNNNNTNLSFDCSSLPGYMSGITGEAGIEGEAGIIASLGGKGGSTGGNSAVCSDKVNTSCNSGNTNGVGGSVTVQYNARIPGVGGAGGGAGSAVRALNIPIPADRKIKISVGAGGLPGGAGANGKAGGVSFVEANGIKYEAEGGKGGNTGSGGNIDQVSYDLTDAQVNGYLKTLGNSGTAGNISDAVKNNAFVKEGEVSLGTAGVKGKLDTETGYRMRMSSGGNGGINNMTSLAQQLPCGMFSNVNISYKNSILSCGMPGKPTPLTHGAASVYNLAGINNYLQFINVGGATGGGGGAWVKDAIPEAEGGAAGSSGYVVIYWGDEYGWN